MTPLGLPANVEDLDWWDIADNTEQPAVIAAKTSLLSLPTELHLAIADNLDWLDTYALRFTCRLMDSVLPPLKDRGKLPSLELSFKLLGCYPPSLRIYRFEKLRASDGQPLLIFNGERRNHHFIPSEATTRLENSYYLANQGYYICFGCGAVKDNKEWYEWRENDMLRFEPHWVKGEGEGANSRAWQRCKTCDEALQKLLPQRCAKHERTRPRYVCRSCGPSMFRVGARHGQRKKQVRKRLLSWL